MLIYHNNVIWNSGVNVTASSESELLPATNLFLEQRGAIWRSGTSTADEYLVWDLGSASLVQNLILSDYAGAWSSATVKIQGNASDSWGAPSFDETITASKFAFNLPVLHELTGTPSYRYWWLSITKNASGDELDLGHAFLANAETNLSEKPDADGVEIGYDDLSTESRSRGGQSFSDQKERALRFKLPFTDVTTTKGSIEGLVASGVTKRPFWVDILGAVSGDNDLTKLHYVRHGDLPTVSVTGYTGSAFIYDLELDLIENL